MRKLRPLTIKFHQEVFEQIETIATNEGVSISEVIRNLVEKGLSERVLEKNTDLIASIVRQQLDIVMKPHVERLAALSSKSGCMSATAAFLNAQALMDLVPLERRKDARAMYDSARKKAVAYMKNRTSDFDNEI